MKNYEVLCVLPGTLSEDEVAPTVLEIVKAIADNGGSNVQAADKGKSRLAYPMKHIRYGYVHVFTFEAEPSSLPALQKKFRMMPQLLRAMINVFDPAMRNEKDKTLAKIAAERELESPGSTTPKRPFIAADDAGEEKPVAVAPVEGTDKPTEENMHKIEEKLDKVLDSAIDEA